jgi:hypothetical protein
MSTMRQVTNTNAIHLSFDVRHIQAKQQISSNRQTATKVFTRRERRSDISCHCSSV